MKKKLLGIFVCMLVFFTSVSLTGCIEQTEELDQYSAEDSWTFDYIIMQYHDTAQSFVPTLKKLSRIELKLDKQGNPGWINLSIRKNLYDADLVSTARHSGQFPPGIDWINFDFEDISITPGDTYYIVVKTESGIFNDYYKWKGTNNDFYSSGNGWKLDPMMSTWDERPDTDFCFKTYGYSSILTNDYQDHPLLRILQNHPELFSLFQRIIEMFWSN